MKFWTIVAGLIVLGCHETPVCQYPSPDHGNGIRGVNGHRPDDRAAENRNKRKLRIAGDSHHPSTYSAQIMASTPEQLDLEPSSEEEQESSRAPVVFPDECRVTREAPSASVYHRKWRHSATIRVGQSHLDTVDISPDETLLLVMSNQEGSVRIYDINSKHLLGNYPMYPSGTFARGQALFWRGGSDEQRFIFGNTEGIALYDAKNGGFLKQLSTNPTWKLRWSDDHRILVANLPNISNQTSKLVFYEVIGAETLEVLETLSFDQRIDGWDLACGNRLLVASFYPTNDIRLFDLKAENPTRPIWKVSNPRYSNSVDISPLGDMVAVGGNLLMLFPIDDPGRPDEFKKYNNNIDTVRFHPDAAAVVTTSYDGQVQVIEPRLDGNPLRRLKRLRHQGTANVYGIVFYKNGTRMVTSSGDRTVRIWATEKVN